MKYTKPTAMIPRNGWFSRKIPAWTAGMALSAASTLLVFGLLMSPLIGRADELRPNIILIFSDDLGWQDTGVTGSDFYETPVLDRMASEGMLFTRAYSNAGNCQPSRACLMSGNYTPRHDVYAVISTNRGPQSLMRLVPIPNKDGLAVENITIADALKKAGYATGHFGKWHLYDANGRAGGGALPTQQGFDVSYDGNGEEELEEGEHGKNKKGSEQDPKGVFSLTRQACAFMEKNKDKPFFIYIAHHAVHTPIQTKPETLQKFESKPAGKIHKNAEFAGCIYDLDTSLGQLMDKLKELDLDSRTLVVFTSDNGGTQGSQEPLRGAKGAYYEGGIREPFIVRWPGVVPAGSRCDTSVAMIDLFPTFLEVAKAQSEKTLDGESLLPLLKQSGALQRTSLFWHFPGYLDKPVLRGRDDVFRTRPVSVVLNGDWKLFLYHEEWVLDGGHPMINQNNAVELYNLKDDPGERKNLANLEPERRDQLIRELETWWHQTGAKIPAEPNPHYDPNSPSKVAKKGKTK